VLSADRLFMPAVLDWKKLGLEYAKARQLALRRAYPDSFNEEDDMDYFDPGNDKVPPPLSMPASPRFRGATTPGDYATLSEVSASGPAGGRGSGQLLSGRCAEPPCLVLQDMQALSTSDYKGSAFWKALNQTEDDEDVAFRFPLVMKSRNRGASVGSTSGVSTPGLLGSKTLSARDLDRADEALTAHDSIGHNGH